jgi:hypothetical protein
MRYFTNESYDMVYNLEFFKDLLEEDREEMKLEEMKRDYGGEMWCEENQEFVEKRQDCGHLCNYYKPCNGKSGRCRSLKNGFIQTGKKFILTKKGLKEVK